MMARRSTKRRPRVVGVIASRADLERAVRMRRPPDLFELRLDRLAGMADQVESAVTEAAHAAHHHSARSARRRRQEIAAAPTAGSARSILESRRLYRRGVTFSLCAAVLAQVGRKRKTSGESFHSTISNPHRARESSAAKAHKAKSHGADIFKVATRTDTPMELGRLLEFMTSSRLDLALAVMGIGKLGAISRVLLARAGSVLIYASVAARHRRRRPTVAGTTPRARVRSVKLANCFSLSRSTLALCSARIRYR